VFATMRRKNRNAKMKNELSQSADHFRKAAMLAAKETSATVGPKVSAARERVQPAADRAMGAAASGWGTAVAAISPIVAAASENARQTAKKSAKANRKVVKSGRKNAKQLERRAQKALGRKQQSHTGRKLAGLALAGVAVGVAGAYVMRKRRDAMWDEYEPASSDGGQVSSGTTGAEDAAFEPADLSGPSGFPTPAGQTEPAVPAGDHRSNGKASS
jgi:hypothetical protein